MRIFTSARCRGLVVSVCMLAQIKPCSARELNFDEPRLYAEIGFDVAVAVTTNVLQKKYGHGKGRDTFPTQGLDDRVSTWLHGNIHKPYTTNRENTEDGLSSLLNDGLMAGVFLSPLFKPSGHRLGTFMTVVHAQEIWFFMNRALKVMVLRERPKYHYTKDPKASDTSSFPSGHAGQAFVMAASADLLFDLPLWARVSIYSTATASSLLRISAERHFFTDTAVGAGIACAGAWMAFALFEKPTLDGLFGQDKKLGVHFTPDGIDLTYRF